MPRGGQRTFVSVPNPLGMQGLIDRSGAADEVRSLPPMTSKQAKKLAQKKNKELNKKMSKEEERRLKLEALNDAIKKDERAKREKKAAMAREKKLEKERKRIEERKSKGMPLVDVRPSQDTIMKFLRGNGTNKKRDSTGAQLEVAREGTETPEPEAETAAEANVVEEQAQQQVPGERLPLPGPVPADTKHAAPAKPFKRFRTGCTPKKEDRKAKTVPESNVDIPKPVNATVTITGPDRMSQENSSDAHPLGYSIEAPAANHLDNLASGLGDLVEIDDEHLRVTSAVTNSARQPDSPPRSLPVRSNSEPSLNKENERPISPAARLERNQTIESPLKACSQRKPLSGTSGNIRRESLRKTPYQYTFGDESREILGQIMDEGMQCETEYARSKRQFGFGRSSNCRSPKPRAMPPPPVPVRGQGSRSGITEAQASGPKPLRTLASRPLLRQATHSSAVSTGDNGGMVMPTCTQLLNISTEDLADFLPSPSQEVRELRGEASAPVVPPPPKQRVREPNRAAREIKLPTWKPPPPVWRPAVSPAPYVSSKASALQPRPVPPIDLASLLSTQDVSFSSQDIRELDETPSRHQGKHTSNQACRRSAGPAVEVKVPEPPYDRSITTSGASGIHNTGGMVGQEYAAATTGLKQDVTTTDRPHHSPHVTPSQKHSALSQAARYRKRSSHSGTPQPQSSMQSSAGVTQETPCRATGPPSRPKPVSYASRYSSGGGRQSLTSTPAAQPTTIPAIVSTSQQPAKSSGSAAKSASLPVLIPISIPQPTPVEQDPEVRAESHKPSMSPPKKRFFTSSNVEVVLAIERSKRTYHQDKRRRELKEREEELARLEEERRLHKERETEDIEISQEETGLSMNNVHTPNLEEDMDAHHNFLMEKALSQQVYAAISQEKGHKSGCDIVVSSTQETDYGDLDVLFTTQPFRTQVFLGPRASQADKGNTGPVPGTASQETDYGDLDWDVDEVERFLEQVDFSDDDYP